MADDPLTRAIDEYYQARAGKRAGVSYEGDIESNIADVAPKEATKKEPAKLVDLRKKVEEKYGTLEDLHARALKQSDVGNAIVGDVGESSMESAHDAPVASQEIPTTGRLGAVAGVGTPEPPPMPPGAAPEALTPQAAAEGMLAPENGPEGSAAPTVVPPTQSVAPQGQLPQLLPGTTGWVGKGPGGSITETTVTKKGIENPEAEALLKEQAQLGTNLTKAKMLAAESRAHIQDRVQEAYEDEKARQQEEWNKYDQARKEAFAAADAKVAAEQKRYENFEPQSFFSHRGAGSAIATTIALTLSGFLQGWTKGAVGGDLMKSMLELISDDAKEQWEKRKVGLRSAEGEVSKTSREWNNRDDFMRARMAGGWQQVSKMADAMIKSPETPEEARQRAIELKMAANDKAIKEWETLRNQTADRDTQTRVAMARFQYGPSAGAALRQGGDTGEIRLNPQQQHRLQFYITKRATSGMDHAMPYISQAETALQDPLATKVVGFAHAHAWQASPTAFAQLLKAEGKTPEEISQGVDLYRRVQTVVNEVAHKQYGSAQTHPELARLQGQLLTDYDPQHILSAFRDIKQTFLNEDNLFRSDLDDATSREADRRLNRGALPQAQTMVGGYTPPTTGAAGAASPGKGPAPTSLQTNETPEQKAERWKKSGFKPL